MKELTLLQEEYLNCAQLFLWAEALDFTEWILGQRKRWKRTEYTLPRLVKWRKLGAVNYGHKLVYTAGKKTSRQHIHHGLSCTKALLAFRHSKLGVFLPESQFRKYEHKAVPEWGIVYPNGTLLFEYSTADNFRRFGSMKRKVAAYEKELARFENVFDNPFYLFVIEASHIEVQLFAKELGPSFYATSAQEFYSVPKGKQLSTSIYIWGGDGKAYPLENHGQTNRTTPW
jgi:hypothetical protein